MDLKQLADEIDYLKKRLANLEHKKLNETKRFEVEVPDDIETYYTTDIMGRLQKLGHYKSDIHEYIYKYGEAFESSEDAILYYKERLLLKRMEDWAEEYNEDWTPNWKNSGTKYHITYEMEQGFFNVEYCVYYKPFTKLPFFKSEKIAKKFIEEFGEEIKEVLC